MKVIALLSIALLSVSAVSVKRSILLESEAMVRQTGGNNETWTSEVEWSCSQDHCFMLDEALDQWLQKLGDNTWVSASEDDLPDCLDEIEGNEVETEVHEQYWRFDLTTNEDSAFMYDDEYDCWWVRNQDGDFLEWFHTDDTTMIPDWVWAQAGMDNPNDEDPWGEGYCNDGCPEWWIGDGICDQACLTDNCLQDEGDCDNSGGGGEDDGDCNTGCPDYWIGDNYCDAACLTEACQMDGGDCDNNGGGGGEDDGGDCNTGCPDHWIGDNICDTACLTDACQQDGGDCDASSDCNPGCPDHWIGDGICDYACLVDACQHDNGDCGGSFLQKSTNVRRRSNTERRRRSN